MWLVTADMYSPFNQRSNKSYLPMCSCRRMNRLTFVSVKGRPALIWNDSKEPAVIDTTQ